MTTNKYQHNPIDKLSDEQLYELREIYQYFDKDNSGEISAKELATLLKSCGRNPTTEYVQTKLNTYDLDQDGTISFLEFLNLILEDDEFGLYHNYDDLKLVVNKFNVNFAKVERDIMKETPSFGHKKLNKGWIKKNRKFTVKFTYSNQYL